MNLVTVAQEKNLNIVMVLYNKVPKTIKINKIVFATRMNLRKLGKSDNVKLAMIMAQANKIITVEPEVINKNNNITFRIPWEAGYDMEQETETVGPAVAFYASG